MRTTTFNAALLLDRLAALAPLCLYGLGCGMLAIKLLSLSGRVHAGWLVAAALIAMAAWALATLPRRGQWYSDEYARAWLDLHNHAGGAIIAGGSALPPVRPGVTVAYAAKRLALPLLFVAAAAAVPEPRDERGLSGGGMERALSRVENELAAAERDDAIAQPDAEALRRQIERLRALAENNPEAAAEALAMLPGRLDELRARRADDLADAMEKASGAMAEMEKAEAGAGEPAELDAAMAELFNSLDNLARREGGMENLSGELREALEAAMAEAGASGLRDMSGGLPASTRMNGDTLERIARGLEARAREMNERYELSSAAGAGGAGQDGISSLSRSMERLQSGLEGSVTANGSGDVATGPGAAPLVFGEESGEAGARFEHSPLPESGFGFPDQKLTRERVALSDDAPPEEFRPIRRSGVAAPGTVSAGSGGFGLGPERALAADRYFSKLGEDR